MTGEPTAPVPIPDVLRALRKAQQRRRLKDAENARIARLMREADRFHGGWPAPPSREARS